MTKTLKTGLIDELIASEITELIQGVLSRVETLLIVQSKDTHTHTTTQTHTNTRTQTHRRTDTKGGFDAPADGYPMPAQTKICNTVRQFIVNDSSY